MIKEFDLVTLKQDLAEKGLKQGDVGTVVMVYEGGRGYEVEFVAYDGETIAVLTLPAEHVRELRHKEIPHLREVAA